MQICRKARAEIEESMRCKWVHYPASPTLEGDYALKFVENAALLSPLRGTEKCFGQGHMRDKENLYPIVLHATILNNSNLTK
jgi:hypothetical protein